MINIFKMLDASIAYTDFFRRYLQWTHQIQSIMISTVGCSKSRHRNADNTLSGQSKFIERFYTYQQSQCRIQSTGNADNYRFTSRMYQTLSQSRYLNWKDFLTAFIKQLTSCRNKRMRFHRTCQCKIFIRFSHFNWNTLYRIVFICPYASSKSRIHHSLSSQTFDINFTDNQLFLKWEAFGSSQ